MAYQKYSVSARMQLQLVDQFGQPNPTSLKNYAWFSGDPQADAGIGLKLGENERVVEVYTQVVPVTLFNPPFQANNRNKWGQFQYYASLDIWTAQSQFARAIQPVLFNASGFCTWQFIQTERYFLSDRNPVLTPVCCYGGQIRFGSLQLFFQDSIDITPVSGVSPEILFNMTVTTERV